MKRDLLAKAQAREREQDKRQALLDAANEDDRQQNRKIRTAALEDDQARAARIKAEDAAWATAGQKAGEAQRQWLQDNGIGEEPASLTSEQQQRLKEHMATTFEAHMPPVARAKLMQTRMEEDARAKRDLTQQEAYMARLALQNKMLSDRQGAGADRVDARTAFTQGEITARAGMGGGGAAAKPERPYTVARKDPSGAEITEHLTKEEYDARTKADAIAAELQAIRERQQSGKSTPEDAARAVEIKTGEKSYNSEAEARAAGLKPGDTFVLIQNGKRFNARLK
jgi:hypothetical protein